MGVTNTYNTTHSPENYAKIRQALSCNCEPYKDTKIYKHWQEDGLQVQRGSRAYRIEGLALFFCRCQVE